MDTIHEGTIAIPRVRPVGEHVSLASRVTIEVKKIGDDSALEGVAAIF